MRRLALGFLLAILATGCGVHVRHGMPGPEPLPPPPPSRPAPPQVQRAPEIHAKEIEARVVRARVIYAKEVRADGGRIGRIERWGDDGGGDGDFRGHGRGKAKGHHKNGKGPEKGHGNFRGEGYAWGSKQVSAPEIHADRIYVKELNAEWIEADVVIAKDIDIGR